MDPNYFSHYLANQAEHPVLVTRSDRLRLAELAVVQSKRPDAHPIFGWIGATLIGAGERLQRMHAPVLVSVDPTHAD